MAATKRELRELLARFQEQFTGQVDIDMVRAWLPQLRMALHGVFPSDAKISDEVGKLLTAKFKRGLKGINRRHKLPVGRLGPEFIEAKYRPLLADRIRASAELIKLNRDQEIERQLRRFVGWSTGSLPSQDKRAKDNLYGGVVKRLQDESFERRRVCIDQGAKLLAAVDDVIAIQHGAIAKKWRHVIPHAGYQSREEHLELDGQVFAVKDNPMLRAGRMKKAGRPYAEDVSPQPAQEPYCQCWWSAIYDLEDLPGDMRVM